MDTVTLLVLYQALPPPPAQTGVTGRVVALQVNGNPAKPTAHSTAEIRFQLHVAGYRPDFTAWQTLRRPCRRVEIWTREEQPDEPLPSIVDSTRTPPPPMPPLEPETGLSEAQLRAIALYGHGARPSEYLRKPQPISQHLKGGI